MSDLALLSRIREFAASKGAPKMLVPDFHGWEPILVIGLFKGHPWPSRN